MLLSCCSFVLSFVLIESYDYNCSFNLTNPTSEKVRQPYLSFSLPNVPHTSLQSIMIYSLTSIHRYNSARLIKKQKQQKIIVCKLLPELKTICTTTTEYNNFLVCDPTWVNEEGIRDYKWSWQELIRKHQIYWSCENLFLSTV